MYYGNSNEQDQNNQREAGENQMSIGKDVRSDKKQGISGRDILLEGDIVKAIIGEAQAYYYYDSLAEMAPNEEDKKVIKGIQEDESKHYHWFNMILHRMGGEVPQITMGELPKDFEEGVEKAIHDELEANEFYLDIAYRATDPYIEMHFMYAAPDEQRHATLLQNILLNMR